MTDNSGPAFPTVGRDGNWQPHCDGLTKREYIAVEAMKALLISGEYIVADFADTGMEGVYRHDRAIRDAAYLMAETMLEEE